MLILKYAVAAVSASVLNKNFHLNYKLFFLCWIIQPLRSNILM